METKHTFRPARNKRDQTASAGEGGTPGLPGSNSPDPEFGIEKGRLFYNALVPSQVLELSFSRSPFPSSLRVQKIRKRVFEDHGCARAELPQNKHCAPL